MYTILVESISPKVKYRTSLMSLDYQSPNLLTFEARFKIQSVLRSFLLMAIKMNSTHRKRNKKQRKRMHLKRGRKDEMVPKYTLARIIP